MKTGTLASPDVVRRGVLHLRRSDEVLRNVIRRAGPCTLRPSRDRYALLVRSIISQQISVLAARTIRRRLLRLMPGGQLDAASVLRLTSDQLRTAGISRQKAEYLWDLSRQVADGQLNFRRIGQLGDDDVIAELVRVRGIGVWTAQMFLIFGLGRPDVFPADDLGVRSSIRDAWGLRQLPSNAEAAAIARPWSPFASIGTWYCWRSLDAG